MEAPTRLRISHVFAVSPRFLCVHLSYAFDLIRLLMALQKAKFVGIASEYSPDCVRLMYSERNLPALAGSAVAALHSIRLVAASSFTRR